MAIQLSYHANCWGPLGGNAVGVTSISQLSYRTFGNMERAIHEIGAAGYAGVELFDGNLLDYTDKRNALKSVLSSASARLIAVYSGANFIFGDVLDEELARIETAARLAAEFDAQHLVVGGGAKRAGGVRPGDIERLGDGLEKVIRIAERVGLRAHYHPHLSTIVEGPAEVKKIFDLTSIDFCPDTAHLAAAGGDPAAMIREHRARISYVHLKGWQKEPFAFTPLDRGDLDISAIMRTLTEIAFDGWTTVELDAWPDPQQGAVDSMAFLQEVRAHE